jgi:hypothetical protein
MFHWECGYCCRNFQRKSRSDLREEGRLHLTINHSGELETLFKQRYTGKKCQSGCGHRFTREYNSHPGFVCPDCGRDHMEYFAGMKVYGELEKTA